MSTRPATTRARRLLERASDAAQRNLRHAATPSTAVSSASRLPERQPRLAPTAALRENGFAVFRGLFPADECAHLSRALKSEAGITESKKFMKVDATNSYRAAQDILLEGRILDAVRSAIGTAPRYLQVSDLHYLHDTAAWHRDSVHRGHDSSEAPDWRDTENPFGVVKAILYLETANAAMGIMAGSHNSPLEMDHERVKTIEEAGGQLVVGSHDDPNRRLTEAQKRTPLAWQAEIGDVLVFDERMYHAGRRVDGGKVTTDRSAPKFTLSTVFGADNHHSGRMYSYFRYARKELGYRELNESLAATLADRGLVLSAGWGNFYAEQPEELRHVYLPDPSRMQPLIDEFGRSRR